MAFKMYKGDAECVADMEQLAVMTNAGWSRTKLAPAPEKEILKVGEPATDEPEKAASKKATTKKRRIAKK